jgi:hypothetical protein
MGRPTLPKNEQRNKTVTVRFSSDEMETITEQLDGKTVAEAVREMALFTARRKVKGEKIERLPRLSREQFKVITSRIAEQAIEESKKELLKRIKGRKNARIETK